MRRKTLIALVALMSLLATSNVALAHGNHGGDTEKRGHSAEQRRELQRVRRATTRFHSVKAAERAGYEEFLECFDSDEGGMGQHYVDLSALDGTVEATHPEAMVYEVKRNGRLGLVAVEYIVPSSFVDPADPPALFGRAFHLNAALDVWVLHAWIWKWNPAGTFADWNPRVRACPET
jgi:hypothetical protein